MDKCRNLKDILKVYEKALCQVINFGKSGIMCSNNVAPKLQEGSFFILGISNPLNTG